MIGSIFFSHAALLHQISLELSRVTFQKELILRLLSRALEQYETNAFIEQICPSSASQEFT